MVHASVDGELDLTANLELEAHLRGCVACAGERSNILALRAAVSNSAPYYQAPVQLERRVRAAMRNARPVSGGDRFWFRYRGWVGAAAALLLVAIGVKGVLPLRLPLSDVTAREVVNDHLRSLTENHLTDVPSSNQHTVKPWFDGKLNFTPAVADLGSQGFPLIGGRLDYLDGRPVAALVYRRRQHVINLFILPAPNANNTLPISAVRAGYNLVHWTTAGTSYWAVSNLNDSELTNFAQLFSALLPQP